MTDARRRASEEFQRGLEQEYARRFPRSLAHFARAGVVVDGTSHGVRWNEPFMPVARRAHGAAIWDLDDHRILDYWQGHYANILGHNPPLIADALARVLGDGRGLQSGMIHELEEEVGALLGDRAGLEAVRFTTSGSLGTFYATLLARAFTGRNVVVKVGGGWHGSQPFGLKGISAHGTSFDHVESEGLSAGAAAEILVARLNDVDGLRLLFEQDGDRIACFLVEPVLGAGGGMAATREYLGEARRLTAHHGALLLCDEIITGFRFRAGSLASELGAAPDLTILGKVIGGGMPVAAVGGRRDVMRLCSRAQGRVKFEGGTYSAHELSLAAARTMLAHLVDGEAVIYPRLAELGLRLRRGLAAAAREAGVAVHVLGAPDLPDAGGSLVLLHVMAAEGPAPASPDALAERRHPAIDDRLLKSVLLLEGLSTRSGLGAASLAHDEADVERTIEAYRACFDRLRRAGLV